MSLHLNKAVLTFANPARTPANVSAQLVVVQSLNVRCKEARSDRRIDNAAIKPKSSCSVD